MERHRPRDCSVSIFISVACRDRVPTGPVGTDLLALAGGRLARPILGGRAENSLNQLGRLMLRVDGAELEHQLRRRIADLEQVIPQSHHALEMQQAARLVADEAVRRAYRHVAWGGRRPDRSQSEPGGQKTPQAGCASWTWPSCWSSTDAIAAAAFSRAKSSTDGSYPRSNVASRIVRVGADTLK